MVMRSLASASTFMVFQLDKITQKDFGNVKILGETIVLKPQSSDLHKAANVHLQVHPEESASKKKKQKQTVGHSDGARE